MPCSIKILTAWSRCTRSISSSTNFFWWRRSRSAWSVKLFSFMILGPSNAREAWEPLLLILVSDLVGDSGDNGASSPNLRYAVETGRFRLGPAWIVGRASALPGLITSRAGLRLFGYVDLPCYTMGCLGVPELSTSTIFDVLRLIPSYAESLRVTLTTFLRMKWTLSRNYSISFFIYSLFYHASRIDFD